MDLYQLNDYKQGLRVAMQARRAQFGVQYTFEKMAKAAGVQKTYLSKVLNGDVHINADQLFLACEYLKLKPAEIDFMQLLREAQVASHPKRVAVLKERIEKVRTKSLKTQLSADSSAGGSNEARNWEYYTNIDLQLVHMFLTVDRFRENPKDIAEQLGISEAHLESLLLKLQQWQMVEFRDGVYTTKEVKLHLPEDSAAIQVFRILNRIKTIEKIRQHTGEKKEDYFFSGVFSAETKFQNRLKRKLLDVLKEAQTEVLKSAPEQVYQLNIDFFRWSGE